MSAKQFNGHPESIDDILTVEAIRRAIQTAVGHTGYIATSTDPALDPARLAAILNGLRCQVSDLQRQNERAQMLALEQILLAENAQERARDLEDSLKRAHADLELARVDVSLSLERTTTAESRAAAAEARIEVALNALKGEPPAEKELPAPDSPISPEAEKSPIVPPLRPAAPGRQIHRTRPTLFRWMHRKPDAAPANSFAA